MWKSKSSFDPSLLLLEASVWYILGFFRLKSWACPLYPPPCFWFMWVGNVFVAVCWKGILEGLGSFGMDDGYDDDDDDDDDDETTKR